MTTHPPFHEEELVIAAPLGQRKALLRSSLRLCPSSALLINLAKDRRGTLDEEYFRIVPDIFLAAGHRVVSFDLPHHGEREDRYGSGLSGMAAAMKDGIDVFKDVQDTGRALVDLCIQRGLARAGLIFLNGTSRGGLSALHIMAGDPRVLACAIHAPVTHLLALIEFRDLADRPITQRSNALALLDGLKDRPIFITIGESDPRVGAEHVREFHARLSACCQHRSPELFCTPGISHGPTYPQHAGYNAAAGFLLCCCGEATKGCMGS